MNKVLLMGNLTRDPELKKTENDFSYCRFTVAVNNGKTKEGKDIPADFIPCRVNGQLAESLCAWKKKGDALVIEGKWRSYSYDKDGSTQYGNECVVNRIEFVGGGKKEEPALEDDLEKNYEEEFELIDGIKHF